MRRKQEASVISQRELAAGIFDLRLSVPDIAAEARAGQFVNVYCADKSRLLPRPISLAGIDREKGTIRLVYRVSGAGTEEFSRLQAGDTVELLGPLGNGFPTAGFPTESVTDAKADQTEKTEKIPMTGESFVVAESPMDGESSGREIFLIGGGIGIPPLLETAKELKKELKGTAVTAVLGYRNSNTFLAEEFAAVCGRVLIASEDGSVGTKGTVLDAMREAGEIQKEAGEIKKEAGEIQKEAGRKKDNSAWFACGPTPMLRALKAAAAENGISCWLSLEERMACGIGACLACVCRTTEKDEHSQVNNRRVCKDGPVFRAEEIDL